MKNPALNSSTLTHPTAARPAETLSTLASLAWARWLALYMFALMWFGTLGYRKLITPDEGRYAEIGREMLASGDWITPRLNGVKYFEKPVLQYWMTASSFKIFGENEFAARFWPAITGFAALLAVLFTLRRILRSDAHGETLAWSGTALLASSAWWIGNGHFLTLDMGVTAFLTMALCGFIWAQQDDATPRETRNAMLAAWAAMALATLSKGLIGLLIPGASLLLYTLWSRDVAIWRRLHLRVGLCLFLVIAAPWFVVVSARNPEFAQFFFVHEHFQRYATHEAQRVQPWFFFIPVLVAGVLPWTALLPAILRQGVRVKMATASSFNTSRFLLVWAAFVFLFFSMSGSKLPAYILPMFPAVAMLGAPLLLSFGRKTAWALAITQAVLGVAALIGATVLLNKVSQDASGSDAQFALWLYGMGAASLATAAMVVWLYRKQARIALIVGLTFSGLLVAQIPMLGYEAYSSRTSSYALAQAVRPQINENSTLYTVRTYDQTLPFYLKHTVQLVEYVDEFALGQSIESDKKMTLGSFIQHWHTDRAPVAVMERDLFDQLDEEGLGMRVVYRDMKRVVVVRG